MDWTALCFKQSNFLQTERCPSNLSSFLFLQCRHRIYLPFLVQSVHSILCEGCWCIIIGKLWGLHLDYYSPYPLSHNHSHHMKRCGPGSLSAVSCYQHPERFGPSACLDRDHYPYQEWYSSPDDSCANNPNYSSQKAARTRAEQFGVHYWRASSYSCSILRQE